jgi:hypothetical protein
LAHEWTLGQSKATWTILEQNSMQQTTSPCAVCHLQLGSELRNGIIKEDGLGDELSEGQGE